MWTEVNALSMLGTIRRVGNISRALRAPVAAVFGSEGVSSSPGAHNISEELQVLNSEWLQPVRKPWDTGGELARDGSDGGFRPLFPSQTAVLDLNGSCNHILGPGSLRAFVTTSIPLQSHCRNICRTEIFPGESESKSLASGDTQGLG